MRPRPLASIAIAMVICAQIAARQAPQTPLFRSSVNVVQVDVSVLDAMRRPLHGLTASDFTLTEDGIPQSIVAFSEVTVPDPDDAPGTWMREVAPDVRSNGAEDGRVLIMLLDDARLRAGQHRGETAAKVKAIAKQVIDRLGPTDQVAIISTFDKRGVQDFTSDHARLRLVVDQFSTKNGGDITMIYDALDTFRNLARYLASIPQRRKAIIFITPTDDTHLSDQEIQRRLQEAARPRGEVQAPAGVSSKAADPGFGVVDNVTLRVQDEFEWAQRSGVTVYSISPGNMHDMTALAEAGSDESDLAALQAIEARQAGASHGTLSSETGGFAISDAAQVAPGVAQIFRETGSYYLLGYSPATLPADGVFRQIGIQVSKPGAIVRGRTGYYAPKPKAKAGATPPSPLVTALAGVLPDPGLPLQVTAAPFARPGHGDATVAIALGLTEVPPTAATGDDISVQVRAFTERGDARGMRNQAVHVGLRPTGEIRGEAHFEVLTQITLNPGKYELRISAHSAALERSGSVYVDVDVPDFSKALALSGVVLTVAPGVPGAPTSELASLMPIVPTTVRQFARTNHATAFLRVYEKGKALPVSLTARILDRGGKAVFEAPQIMAADRFGPTHSADYLLDLPLESLSPGSYLLTLEAALGKTTVRRDVRFSVK